MWPIKWWFPCGPLWLGYVPGLVINTWFHYNDVTMGVMASQMTNLTIVYSIVFFRLRSKQISKLRVTGLCAGNSPETSEFHAQMASNAEKVSIWWRHHVFIRTVQDYFTGTETITEPWRIRVKLVLFHTVKPQTFVWLTYENYSTEPGDAEGLLDIEFDIQNSSTRLHYAAARMVLSESNDHKIYIFCC